MRGDQPRQQGMDRWNGPHSKIISATPGLDEYRQIHLAENNPRLWPAIPGVETVIPAVRRIDGLAEVTFASVLSPLRGRKQTRLAYKRVPANRALRGATELGALVRRRRSRGE